MADHKNCKYYADCDYRNGVGECPYSCIQYKHKDAVIVVRCKDCKKFCRNYAHMRKHCGLTGLIVEDDDFCSSGERRETE